MERKASFAEAFEKRCEEAELFSRRFGMFSKTDYEVLLFTVFMDSYDGEVSDHGISKQLGLTESRVRNLRIKSQLLYPKEIVWRDELVQALDKGFFNSTTMTITVTIEDPSAQLAIKYEVEKALGNVLLTLNPKHLCLPVGSYVILATELEEDPDTVLEKLNSIWQRDMKMSSKISKESLLKQIWKSKEELISISELIAAGNSLFSYGGLIISAIQRLIQ